jgi:hypothetical protein
MMDKIQKPSNSDILLYLESVQGTNSVHIMNIECKLNDTALYRGCDIRNTNIYLCVLCDKTAAENVFSNCYFANYYERRKD